MVTHHSVETIPEVTFQHGDETQIYRRNFRIWRVDMAEGGLIFPEFCLTDTTSIPS